MLGPLASPLVLGFNQEESALLPTPFLELLGQNSALENYEQSHCPTHQRKILSSLFSQHPHFSPGISLVHSHISVLLASALNT